MQRSFTRLRRLLDEAVYADEKAKILEAMLPLGSYHQLKNLYDEAVYAEEQAKILEAMLRVATFDQLRQLRKEVVYAEDDVKVLEAMLPLASPRQLKNLQDEAVYDGERAKILDAILTVEAGRAATHSAAPASTATEYDVFIAHAAEDKDFVNPLASRLSEMGLKVWYDTFSLRIGDSLRREIDKGLARSRYGVVVLSPSFFQKHWPQKELDGLAAKEQLGGPAVLPVWHRIDRDTLIRLSPTLADIKAAKSSEGIEAVAVQIRRRVAD